MATRLLVIADTHVPKRARRLPDQVWEQVDVVDVVVHAGDWVEVALLDELEARARRLVAVHGNNDHGVLREPFCTYLTATAEAGALRDVELHRLPRLSGRA